jgi:hypothetical protein
MRSPKNGVDTSCHPFAMVLGTDFEKDLWFCRRTIDRIRLAIQRQQDDGYISSFLSFFRLSLVHTTIKKCAVYVHAHA